MGHYELKAASSSCHSPRDTRRRRGPFFSRPRFASRLEKARPADLIREPQPSKHPRRTPPIPFLSSLGSRNFGAPWKKVATRRVPEWQVKIHSRRHEDRPGLLVPDPFSPLSRHDFRETVISRKRTEQWW
ncbi:hypothetical protein EAG_07973 [Camponotus floridanus]|uniref:Uncharacterized protein n=1 Tax=Camponotus floridanus TaxID=104421 RepID=E2ACW8_CAMFO|nr:hypothetical protein EAG_07973 [Camponotus floridanus]